MGAAILLIMAAAPGAAAKMRGRAGELYHHGFALSEAVTLASGSTHADLDGRLQPTGLRAAQVGTGGQDRRSISRVKAMGASLLLPGLGQMLAGHPGRARLFMTAEAGILTSYVVFRVQGRVRKERYIEYAELFAGNDDVGGRQDWYYRNLGQYHSSEDYVDEIARSARAMYRDDIQQRDAYVAEHRPGPDEEWEWASEAHRLEYREMRKASRNALRHADLMIGIALLNRVLSAVDAAILMRTGAKNRGLYASGGADGTGYLGLAWEL
jgi:hypothetical protein